MKQKDIFIGTIIVFFLLFYNCTQQSDFPILKGPYLGQKPPGDVPKLFAPGIFSTEANEFNAVFTPEGDAVYFTGKGEKDQDIFVIERKNDQWQKRKIASFSGVYRDVDPFITFDGSKLLFSSNRPKNGTDQQEDCDFWYVEKLSSGQWGKAKHLDTPCTPGKHDFYYVSSRDGSIYYSIFDDGKGDIYFIPPQSTNRQSYRLDAPINTEYNEHDPFIAPDGSYLIFTSDRPGGLGSADLYICFRLNDGSWSKPKNMESTINSNKYDYCAILSPNGKYFFFSSSRSGNGDVYWVDVRIIRELKPDELK